MAFPQSQKDGFFNAVDTLKKYRRADIIDEAGNSILELLYTDLLPNEQVLKACLKDNTTFLIGRKGTGKSTIFLKLQQELRKRPAHLCCYIDANYVFDSSKSDFVALDYLKDYVPSEILHKYLLERTFIQNVLKEIRKEISEKSKNFLENLKSLVGLDKATAVKRQIDGLIQAVEDNEKLKQIEIPIFSEFARKSKDALEQAVETSQKTTTSSNAGLTETGGTFGTNLSTDRGEKKSRKKSEELESQFSEIFLKVFRIKEIITEIKDVLSVAGVKNLVILLDDFSEIDDSSMRVFVDVLLAPLNNWSDEFIKFKVATYPGRQYFGRIDKGKVDIIDLDFYSLYSEFDRNTMEDRAIDFTKRLIEKRVSHFLNTPVEIFFDTSKENMADYYELIFQISMNVPRIVGYVLYYCYESNIIFDKPINRAALEAAASKYYEKVIASFFEKTTHSMMAFEEKISTLQLEELLSKIVSQMGQIRRKIFSGEVADSVLQQNRTNAYTSHFYFLPTYEKFLSTLELNFFISKYEEMSDRDGAKQSIYALNYGLCRNHNMRWGKPKGGDYRKYFISRSFDFNKLIDEFLKTSKKIQCVNPDCAKVYPFEQLSFLEFNKMKCPACGTPVQILSNAEQLRGELEKLDKSKLLPPLMLSILHEVNNATRMRAKEIGQELDRSYQMVGRQAKKLDEEHGLLNRKPDGPSRVYELTDKAKEQYFQG